MGRSKLILDTNIAAKLNGPAYREEADRIIATITREFKIVASPQTFYELLDTFQAGDEQHFESDRRLFNLMVGPGNVDFLPLPGAFALSKSLGLKSPFSRFGPEDFRKCLGIILHAKTREDLLRGKVRVPHTGKKRTAGFEPEIVRHQHDEGRRQHREWLERIRDGTAVLAEPVLWAIGYAGMLGCRITEEQGRRFSNGLEAVYAYGKRLCRLVSSGAYNFEKHRGDWIDLQQLHYLYDPAMYLLTDDRALKERVGAIRQGARILGFREFLKNHGFTPKH